MERAHQSVPKSPGGGLESKGRKSFANRRDPVGSRLEGVPNILPSTRLDKSLSWTFGVEGGSPGCGLLSQHRGVGVVPHRHPPSKRTAAFRGARRDLPN